MAQTVRVKAVQLYALNLRARMPFRYGIATLTALPHLFVQLTLEVDGRDHVGLAADHLVPKWFTKLPGKSFRDDVVEMLDVIRSASRIAERARPAPSVFALWQRIYAEQRRWGDGRGYPPLLYGFGASLIEPGDDRCILPLRRGYVRARRSRQPARHPTGRYLSDPGGHQPIRLAGA